MEKNGIHIIDLHKTVIKLDEAAAALKQIVKSGRRVLFVATKKQAKEIVAEKVAAVGMPYVTERWAGGMLTNFPTIRKAVKKMATIDKMTNDGTFDNFSKREKLQIARQRAKLEKNLGSIADLNRLPAALFVIDVQKEQNAVKEAKRLSITCDNMLLTSLTCLLCNSSLYCSSVSKNTCHEGILVCWERSDSCLSDSLSKSLELLVLSNEVSLATESNHDSLLTAYLSDNAAF